MNEMGSFDLSSVDTSLHGVIDMSKKIEFIKDWIGSSRTQVGMKFCLKLWFPIYQILLQITI